MSFLLNREILIPQILSVLLALMLTCVTLNRCDTCAVTSDSVEQPHPKIMILVGG